MLKIAICDDNEFFLREAQRTLIQDKRVGEITLYSTPKTLLDDIARSVKYYDAVLLDIEFGTPENGIDIAEQIGYFSPETKILYVTGYNDRFAQHVLLGEAEPIGYMTKPLRPDIVSGYLDKICKKKDNKAFITLNSNGKKHTISLESITYLESKNHAVIIHTDNDNLVVYDKLDNLSDKLSASFIRCHKSYIVNMERIQRLDKDHAWISAELAIPVSRANQTHVRTSFFRYIGQKL